MAAIVLKLYATLGKYTPPDADRYHITPGITIGQLMRELEIPEKSVKLVFVNGRRMDPDTPLRGDERVGLFPPVGGG
jgi:molybdopterin converting factor small subunit